jgi:hypothetical protein
MIAFALIAHLPNQGQQRGYLANSGLGIWPTADKTQIHQFGLLLRLAVAVGLEVVLVEALTYFSQALAA